MYRLWCWLQATLMTLFNQALVDSGKADPSNPPVIAVQLELGKSFAFIELRTPEVPHPPHTCLFLCD